MTSPFPISDVTARASDGQFCAIATSRDRLEMKEAAKLRRPPGAGGGRNAFIQADRVVAVIDLDQLAREAARSISK